jgi:enamine deaminase RidA (YjgF/YER057c/UK114 family)
MRMIHCTDKTNGQMTGTAEHSDGERFEMELLGMIGEDGTSRPSAPHPPARPPVPRRAVHAPDVLNEAYDYAQPSSFSRAVCLNFGGQTLMLISGTASVDERGETVHAGDFRGQLWRTFRNITQLLEAENMTWHDIVRTTCYLRDIERDYDVFNEIRTEFYSWLGLDPLPASTGIQARICRSDLLVEIEAIAVRPADTSG